jgi:hypothetical protein
MKRVEMKKLLDEMRENEQEELFSLSKWLLDPSLMDNLSINHLHPL